MRRATRAAILAAALSCGAAATARADVTITSTTSGKAAMMDLGGEGTTRIKGNKMRMDSKRGNTASVVIMDVDGLQMIVLDDQKKEATVLTLARLQEALGKVNVATATVKTKVTPTAEKKQVAGFSCTVYDVGLAMPFNPAGGNEDMGMTMVMGGPACLSKDVPGYADVARLFKAAADKGFIFTDPRAAKGPGASQAKGLAELYRAMADGGVALEQVTNISIEGSGPMAAMMGKMGKTSMTTTVVKVETGDLSADLFVIPAGYKVKTQ